TLRWAATCRTGIAAGTWHGAGGDLASSNSQSLMEVLPSVNNGRAPGSSGASQVACSAGPNTSEWLISSLWNKRPISLLRNSLPHDGHSGMPSDLNFVQTQSSRAPPQRSSLLQYHSLKAAFAPARSKRLPTT